jgi:hypothetical protein
MAYREETLNWWERTEITDTDIALMAHIYNDCLEKIDPFKYRLTLDKTFTKKPWFKDMFNLVRLITSLGVKPREYIQAQISEYVKPIKKAREVPTIRMMASPSGIDRYTSYCKKHGKLPSNNKRINATELEKFSLVQMQRIMKTNHLTEKDFFRDPYLMAQLSRDFVLSHPTFLELNTTGFYRTSFGVDGTELIS